ncbi:MAG: 3-oxoacyl-ACP synthase [Deltaproteobacteria bacterium]|nr:3-oxoacyl-ACP synthase [Deltaproteobacteria bacterium]
MNFSFANKRIAGVLTVLPANERTFMEDMKDFDFPEEKSLKLKKVMGYDKHRIVKNDATCVSDLAVHGFRHLFDKGLVNPDDLDALVVITQSPDFFMPPTSNVIQGRLNLKHDMLCLDISQGCAGFVVGLMQAFMMLEQASIKKVALVNADVLSRKVSRKDKNSFPLIGDAACITIVEKTDGGQTIHANLKMDGSRHDVLIIPAGGFRTPSTPQTAVLEDVGDNNFRAKDNLTMNGTAVFNFVQVEVPPMIDALLEYAALPADKVDYFMFHQPNKFMLHKLADKMKVSRERMPANIVENFGNASGATIPTNITFNLASELTSGTRKICMAGFGVGLTWASLVMDVGPLAFCEIIDYQEAV